MVYLSAAAKALLYKPNSSCVCFTVHWNTQTQSVSILHVQCTCCHLQSVLNAAARSVAGLRRSGHITEMLASLHWLCASERIQFKLSVLIFRSLHGLAPQYLVDDLIHVADMPSRHRLWSERTHRLGVPRVQHATIGDRTFRAAGSRLWNGLPSDVIDCQTVDTFSRQLKHFFLMFLFLTLTLKFFT